MKKVAVGVSRSDSSLAAIRCFLLSLRAGFPFSSKVHSTFSFSMLLLAVSLIEGQAASFKTTLLATNLQDPMQLSIARDGDVYFAERTGGVFVWEKQKQAVRPLGKLEKISTNNEDGLLGIALHPGFSTNRWLFIFHSETKVHTNFISRFTVTDQGLDLASRKIIFQIPDEPSNANHSGGGIGFDAKGNLYFSTGDNSFIQELDGYAPLDERPGRKLWDAQRTAGNSRDLRGKILRIKPREDGSYEVPEGNLFPKDGSQGFPEIYIMGVRNPFRFSVDEKTGWLFWGDVGPDATEPHPDRGPAGFDEFNVATQAGNFGWPLFLADNRPFHRYDFVSKKSLGAFDPARPVNQSPNNTGIQQLPPAQPALIFYPPTPSARFPLMGSGARSAMAGPVFHFDPKRGSEQFPREMDGSLIIFEWERGWIREVRLTPDARLQEIKPFLGDQKFKRPISMEFGPDGALYVLEYGQAWSGNKDGQLVRISL